MQMSTIKEGVMIRLQCICIVNLAYCVKIHCLSISDMHLKSCYKIYMYSEDNFKK